MHKLKIVWENKTYKIFWEFEIERPDLVLVN